MGKCFLNLRGNIFQSCFREGITTVGNYSFKMETLLKIAGYPRRSLILSLAAFLRSPSRSPDLNPIENLFHVAGQRLRIQSLKQKFQYECYEAFCQRIRKTLLSFPVGIIDRRFTSMHKRLDAIIRLKGQRNKY